MFNEEEKENKEKNDPTDRHCSLYLSLNIIFELELDLINFFTIDILGGFEYFQDRDKCFNLIYRVLLLINELYVQRVQLQKFF